MARRKTQKKLAGLAPDLELIRIELEVNDCAAAIESPTQAEVILKEIAFALKPRRHERRIAPYGSIVCPVPFSYPGATKVAESPSLSEEFLRACADGRHTILVQTQGAGAQLWQLEEPCDKELDLLNLSRHSGGVALKRIESGLVSLVHGGWVYTIRGRDWLVRGPVEDMAKAIRQVAPGTSWATEVLELCCYVLSPKNLGTTFVCFLEEPTPADSGPWIGKPDLKSLSLALTSHDDYSRISHLVRHHDGAFLVGPDSELRSLEGHLTFTAETAILVPAMPNRGTRHASAKRYSYEHPACVVFVVSEDGYVSAFSDGAQVGNSPVLASREARALRSYVPGKARDVSHTTAVATCPRCKKDLLIQIVIIIGWKEMEEVSCPVCGEDSVYRTMCFSLQATPIKKY